MVPDASDTTAALWVELGDPGDVDDIGDIVDVGSSRGGVYDEEVVLGLNVRDCVPLRSLSTIEKTMSATDARKSESPASSWRETLLLGCCSSRNCCLKDSVTVITSATLCIASVALRVSHTVVGVWLRSDDVGEVAISVFVVQIHREASRC